MTQAEVRVKLKDLVARYESVKAAGKLGKYSEEDTKTNFIMPLFKILGWDFTARDEVTAEEQISGDRVDYGFYLNGFTKFYLEAKKFSADLHKEEFAKQAIRYSWNKGVTWALLTDFESVIVFNALSPEKSLYGKKYFEIPYTEYLTRFDQLWLLSKEAFSKNLLDTEAEQHGKKVQKILVTEKLARDLNECRRLLTNGFRIWNKEVKPELIDEGVQKLIDRLVFIRVAEDRHIEPTTLIPLLHEWNASGKAGETSLYQTMIKKFRELDKIYNSNLFSDHPFELWEEYSGATERVIKILYGEKGYFEYDFSVIPADVLGSVYEGYLGYKLQQSKTEGNKDLLSKDSRKRKEQGIYYTPKFIVDYIVGHTLGPVLDKCKTINDLQKIKVLDPACGSGSFLVAAFQAIVKKYEEFNQEPADAFIKIQILENNIYGVDLDEQAVELARLNLLLNTFDSKLKLPNLGNNIKNGNSLISDTGDELRKYFGKDYRDKKPFNWEEEFRAVFEHGGFDCVIGNPPWGANIDKEAEYLAFKYPESTKAHKDTYKIFIDLALAKLKSAGQLGYVVPNTFLYQPRYSDIKNLLDKFNYLVVNLGERIFGNVELPCCILIVEKEKGTNHIVLDLMKVDRAELPGAILNLTSESVTATSAAVSRIVKNTGLTFDDVFLMKDAGINYQAVKVGKGQKGQSTLGKQLFYEGVKDKAVDVEYWKGSNITRYYIESKTDQYVRTNYKEFKKENERVILNADFFLRRLKYYGDKQLVL